MNAGDAAQAARLVERACDTTLPLHQHHDAFAQLVAQSQHFVFGMALTMLRDPDGAENAAQEAFTTAWLRLRQLRDPCAFPAWLRTIVAAQCARRLRRRTADPERLPVAESVEAHDRRLDYRTLVAAAVDTLPAGERNVTVLFYFLGYTQPEIAWLLQLNPGTVGKRLHSARLRIRRGSPRSVKE